MASLYDRNRVPCDSRHVDPHRRAGESNREIVRGKGKARAVERKDAQPGADQTLAAGESDFRSCRVRSVDGEVRGRL